METPGFEMLTLIQRCRNEKHINLQTLNGTLRHSPLLIRFILVAEHKQLFVTTHFQSGLAPAGPQIGDKIAILHGSRTPCILRVANETQMEYKSTSQCYLDGWMYGTPNADIPRPHPHRR